MPQKAQYAPAVKRLELGGTGKTVLAVGAADMRHDINLFERVLESRYSPTKKRKNTIEVQGKRYERETIESAWDEHIKLLNKKPKEQPYDEVY